MKTRTKILMLIAAVLLTSTAFAVFTAVTTTIDNRRTSKDYPVWSTTTVFTIDASDGAAELTKEVLINGTLKDLSIVVGAAAGITGTVNVDFDDNNDIEFDSNAALSESTTATPTIDKVVTNFKIRVDPSDDPTSGSWTITVNAKGI